MGASTFSDSCAKGRATSTALEAFRALQDEARYQSGHDGYSGTIAEADGFRIVDPHRVAFRHSETSLGAVPGSPKRKAPRKIKAALPTIEEAASVANFLIDTDDTFDKYGAAGCLEFRRKGGRTVAGWLFFGWAAS